MKLQQARWTDFNPATGQIIPFTGEQPLQMCHSYGTALPLVRDDSLPQKFGADVIRFAPGKGVGLHTHIGAHILFVTSGNGILTYNEEKHNMFPGMVYLIPSNIPHAIDATSELVIIAIGNDHQPADSETRLDIVN